MKKDNAVIYKLEINANPNGKYEVKGYRYQIQVSIDPAFEKAYRQKGITKTKNYMKIFSGRVRRSIKEKGEPLKGMKVTETLEGFVIGPDPRLN